MMNEETKTGVLPENPRLMPVAELLDGREFYVPDYQRGYRWRPSQVTQLLEDLLTFAIFEENKTENKHDYYCLQPVVVRYDGKNKWWEVIDGQQRLTTVKILLHWFRQEFPDAKDISFSPYTIEYETRRQTTKDIEELKSDNCHHIEGESIDVFFMKEAYQAIGKWFKDADEHTGKIPAQRLCEQLDFPFRRAKGCLFDLLTCSPGQNPTVQFLWFEADENESGIQLFNNLNTNKLGLTDAELVKGLFLLKSNFDGEEDDQIQEQYRKALKWERMENAMHDDSFWSFITPRRKETANRIDLLLELVFRVEYVEEHPLEVIEKVLGNDEDAKKLRTGIWETLFGKADDGQSDATVKRELESAKKELAGKTIKRFRDDMPTDSLCRKVVEETLKHAKETNFLKKQIEEALDEEHPIYNRYNALFNKPISARVKAIEEEWTKIEDTFRILEDWYKDPLVYNLVGYLCQTQTAELQDIFIRFCVLKGDPVNTRDDFIAYLGKGKGENPPGLIKQSLSNVEVLFDSPDGDKPGASSGDVDADGEDLQFADVLNDLRGKGLVAVHGPAEEGKAHDYVIKLGYKDRKMVFNLLLLLNVHHLNCRAEKSNLTPGEKEACKFPFAILNNDWDIEHVDSRTSNPLDKPEDIKTWIMESLVSLQFQLEEGQLADIVDISKSDDSDAEKRRQLMTRLKGLAKEGEDEGDEKDNISNLVLLDAGTNRSYQNALFVTKRRKIIARREKGQYVPETTSYVFFKLFEKDPSARWQWTDDDRQAYANYIAQELGDYLPKAKEAAR